MRIISKFQDFYDSSLAYGHDEKITYVRHLEEHAKLPKEFEFMRLPFVGGFRTSKKKKIDHEIFPFTVAFCGKLYRGIGTCYWSKNGWGLDSVENVNHFYNAAEILEYLRTYGLELNVERKPTRNEAKWDSGKYRRPDYLTTEGMIQRYFDQDKPGDTTHLDFFATQKLPIAVWQQIVKRRYAAEDRLLTNCRLQDFHFGKVMAAPIAFQELDMFLGGIVAGEDNPMVGITDQDLARAKGFDCYSFKKEPTKRKRKSCKTS